MLKNKELRKIFGLRTDEVSEKLGMLLNVVIYTGRYPEPGGYIWSENGWKTF
jgi:hypothetical protein